MGFDGELICLDDGVVVGPCLFQAVREQFDGLRTFRPPDQKAYCRSAKTTDQPKNIFLSVSPLFMRYSLFVAASHVGCSAESFRFCGDRDFACVGKRLHFGYGFSSLRSSAWHRGPCGGKDAGDCGRCGNSAKSRRFRGQRGERGGAREGFKGWDHGRSAGAAGGADHLARETDEQRIETGEQTLWRGGMGAVQEVVGRTLVGIDRSVLWDLRYICPRRSVDDARAMAADLGESRRPHALDGGRSDGPGLWIFLREQLCAGWPQGTQALAVGQTICPGGYT